MVAGHLNTIEDGPWRIAERIQVVLQTRAPSQDAWAAATDLASRLGEAGLPISRFYVAGPAVTGSERPSDWPSAISVEAKVDPGAALRAVLDAQDDCLVVDGSSNLDPAAVLELRRVASTDPMIAGVSPHFGRQPPGGCRAAVSYVPLPDGRCLYLKASVLAQCPPDLGPDGIDWDRYALSINRYGFRMAVANHALPPGIEAGVSDRANLLNRATALEGTYPGTRKAVVSFLTGAPQAAERLLSALAPNTAGKREVAFDLTHIGPSHSGTSELARALIGQALTSWAERWDIYVVGSRATCEFHFADAPIRPKRIEPEDPKAFAAFIRVGQPFSWKELDHAVRRAPALVFFMLDTIGLDCVRLAPDELDALWRFTLAEADGLLFNSAFTQRQFERRFRVRRDLPRLASLHSLRLDQYAQGSAIPSEPEGVLVLGNSFGHKYVQEAARVLAAADLGEPIVALGPTPGTVAGVVSYASGALDERTMSELYRSARVVVYPSLYEGFGFPVLHALAHRRPVLVRALAPFAEIIEGLPEAANIHVFESDAELLRLVGSRLRWTERTSGRPARGWEDSTADLLRILDEALRCLDHERIVRRIEFMRGRMEWMRRKPMRAVELAGEEEPSDNLDRLAGLAGRTVQDLVLKLGRGRASARALRLASNMVRRRNVP